MSTGGGAGRLGRRLWPLYAAEFLTSVSLWVPVEKLFMTKIGFDAASIGVMAALYALVVPLFEVPSGVLADRWSRRGVLVLAALALAISETVGGLSRGVGWYMVSAMFLGVYFAMQSGTLESMVYDALLEETGTSDLFERTIGRTRMLQSVGLVLSAIVGGALAEALSLRVTYFLTVPFTVASGLAVLAFREPRLHRREAREPLWSQVAATYRSLLERGQLRAIVALTVLTSLMMQAIFEFGPLWLVALAVPAVLYGPHWAGLTSALGLGGLLGARRMMTNRGLLGLVGVVLVACCVVLAMSRNVIVVVVAQITMIMFLVAVGVPVARRFHDAVPSTLRAGAASGTSTLSWLCFLPFAFVFGVVSNRAGVHAAGWMLVVTGVGTALLVLIGLSAVPAGPVAVLPKPMDTEPVPELSPVRAAQAAFAPDRFLPPDDPDWPGHWFRPPSDWHQGLLVSGNEQEALAQVRAAIGELPQDQRRIIMMRDVQGKSSAELTRALAIDEDAARDLLHQARSSVRAHLESLYELSNR